MTQSKLRNPSSWYELLIELQTPEWCTIRYAGIFDGLKEGSERCQHKRSDVISATLLQLNESPAPRFGVVDVFCNSGHTNRISD